jgi:integrase
LLQRYVETVTPTKRGAAQERYKVRLILNHAIADLSLDRLTAMELAKFRDERLQQVAGDTVRREMALIQHCLELARKEWGVGPLLNPVRQIKLPPPGRSRTRRASPAELALLLGASSRTRCYWLPAMILMAIETGMRRSELLSIEWANVNEGSRTVYLETTKNGHPRTVPLSAAALSAIQQMPRNHDKVFPVTANAFRLAWERLRRRTGIAGLRFHDLRHEAVSRFFEKGRSMPEVAAISGHRDPRMLMRYAHPTAEDIAEKLR